MVCPEGKRLWISVITLAGIRWAMNGSVQDEHLAWDSVCGNKSKRKLTVLLFMPYCGIFGEMNKIVF